MDSSVDAKQLSQKTETWKRSVGTLSSKMGLADLVKKKVADRQSKISTVIGNNGEDKQGKTSDSASILPSSPSVKSATPALLNNTAVNNSKISSSSSGVRSDIGGGSGLSLLGNYSDSNTSDSDSNTSENDNNNSDSS